MKKEDNVIELFFNEPAKQWHFEEILKTASISRPQLLSWLKKFTDEGLVKRIKPRGKMPYYIGNYENPNYQIKKRIFALNRMEKNGFLKHLVALSKAKTVIIFGSLSRWDWYKESDVDLFIYGAQDGFDYGKYRKLLQREIQIFTCKNKNDIKKFSPDLLKNIIEGYIVKGKLDFIEVEAHA